MKEDKMVHPHTNYIRYTHLKASSVMMVRRRPRMDTATPIMEMTLRVVSTSTISGASTGFGRMS